MTTEVLQNLHQSHYKQKLSCLQISFCQCKKVQSGEKHNPTKYIYRVSGFLSSRQNWVPHPLPRKRVCLLPRTGSFKQISLDFWEKVRLKVWINPNSAIALSFKAYHKKSNFLHRLDAFSTKS
jgi:hypothetical protein